MVFGIFSRSKEDQGDIKRYKCPKCNGAFRSRPLKLPAKVRCPTCQKWIEIRSESD